VLGHLLHPLLQLGGQHHEVRAGRLDRRAVVLAEVGDRLVVRREPARQPHQLDVAPSLALQPPARRHAVQVAVDVEIQERHRMVGRPPRRRRRDHKAQASQVELVDEDVDHPRRIVFADIVLQAARQQRRLTAILTLDEAAHPSASDIVMSEA